MALGSTATLASELTSLPAISWKRFTRDLHDGRIEAIRILSDVERLKREAEELKQLVTEDADALSTKSKKERFDEQSWDSLKPSPLYDVLCEYKDVLPDDIPAELPQDKGVQHEIDLVPGTKYCVYAAVTTAARAIRCGDAQLHLRKLFALMRKHNLYANLKKCIFGSSKIPVLGCLVGKNGVRADPGKVRVINEWPTPSNVKELRQFLGLATYLCKYVSNYAGKIRPLSQLLKKDAAWDWTAECQQAFDAVKQGLTEAPILAVADQDRPFHVVCDASDFAIGCALKQHDHEGRDRVVYYQSRQLKPAERNYPVHDKELLAMKYALAKFRVYLLGGRPFVVYTDHASLRTAIKSPHISQRMARWLSLFAEYNFQVEYKPGILNVVANALSRRSDYAVYKADANAIGVVRTSTPLSSLLDDVRSAYANDADTNQLLNYFAAPSDKSRQKLAKHLRTDIVYTTAYCFTAQLTTTLIDLSSRTILS
ncbi:unnamed protein product [Phytophthora fragariaefolia]|uniref:Unnamed protein product n=1 Tax=Phytophthora fragariaefolia TaxID=1490495 RepID=A0A9W7D7T6_9STRA|nr:unnamed protein product [Phytophthora fragariaefolia]